MPSHKKIIIGEEVYTDRLGRERKRVKTAYVRSEETEKEMEKIRLKNLFTKPNIKDPVVLKRIEDPLLVFQVQDLNIAHMIAATRLRRVKRAHKLLTGGEILAEAYNKERMELSQGFPSFPQLFVFFGYTEGVINFLPSLVSQLISMRSHLGEHAWLFIPYSLQRMCEIWKDQTLLSLSGQPFLRVMASKEVSVESTPVQPVSSEPKESFPVALKPANLQSKKKPNGH